MINIKNSKGNNDQWRRISGDPYDWTLTLAPERPYIHDYTNTLTMKLLMSVPDGAGGSNVFCTFERALQTIKETDILTRHIAKIVYLVGWQYNGHDDKYPAWDEVNPALKRPEDNSARDSYLWLAKEAKKYNTTISVHTNMTDAYDDSPLWDTYVTNNAIAHHSDGSLMQIGNYNNRPAYQICYHHEWESGLAVQRIDKLIDLLQLDDAGTVHIDAYFPRMNPYFGISEEEQSSYMRKTIRYFRNCRIDVTSENFSHLRNDPFIGLQPWSWWFDQTREQHFLERPASLVSGGLIRDYTLPGIPHRIDLAFLFGTSMHGEDIFYDHERTAFRDQWHALFIERYCLTTLRYQFLNQLQRIKLDGEAERRVISYSNGVTVHLYDQTIRQNGRLLQQGTNLILPALWKDDIECIAYSKDGYDTKTWSLPEEWEHIDSVSIYQITHQGLVLIDQNRSLHEGTLELSLEPNTAVVIRPSNAPMD
ncbi:hypothetical protein G4V62_09995 [Bacillaceae bacterium SIJ1]|uniref:endo-alpha-N-acetylgalactosaminidase family protein n=1 Tax=Litoribacterium kuwaitense TaxID=1398745 RepID=UPI0013EE20F7|nr:endo-alpha-N-acetylgalactosaminidase family protein [Litoribacterium kuwaitense]NGP45269.1 hypothetical protein [Litoribacterium kuwaitense]